MTQRGHTSGSSRLTVERQEAVRGLLCAPTLPHLDDALKHLDTQVLFVDGNHDNHDRIATASAGHRAVTPIRGAVTITTVSSWLSRS